MARMTKTASVTIVSGKIIYNFKLSLHQRNK